jgi:hypothetical protein
VVKVGPNREAIFFWVSEFLKADGSSDCKYGRKLDRVEHTVGISRSSVGKRNVGDPFTPASRRLRKDHATAPPFRHTRAAVGPER